MLSKKRILVVSHENSQTGAPAYFNTLCRSLAHSAYSVVTYLKRDVSGGDTTSFDFVGRAAEGRRVWHRHSEAFRIALDFLGAHEIGAVIANSVACIEWVLAAEKLGIPAIAIMHEDRDQIERFMHASVIPRKQIKVENAAWVAESQFKRSRALVVGNRNLLCPYQPGFRGEVIGPAQANRMVSCGTRSVRKGFDLFVDLASIWPEMSFVWLGGAGDCGNLSVPPNVEVVEHVEIPESVYRPGDFFLHLAREDPAPIAVKEAARCGLPVLTSVSSGDAHRDLDCFAYVFDCIPSVKALRVFLAQALQHTQPFGPRIEKARDPEPQVANLAEIVEVLSL